MSKFTATAKTMSKQETEKRLRASKLAKQLGLGTRSVAGRLLAGQVEPEWLNAASEGWHVPKTLMWPVAEGWYVRGYGSGEAGYHLAVDIMGERGTAIRAAAPGIVAYSNNNVRGYGNMVILIHPGGWVTTYAHNSSNLVSVGERVGAGRTLALLGNTGISRGPHLHFEFIFNGRMCNPVPLFRPGVRHRYGSNFPIQQVVWNPLGKRPKEIKCDHRRRHPRSYYYDLHPERSPYRNDEDLETEKETSEEVDHAESEFSEGISEVETPTDESLSEESSDKTVPVAKAQKKHEVAQQALPEKQAVVKTPAGQTPEISVPDSAPVKIKPIERPSRENPNENPSSEEKNAKNIAPRKEEPVEKVSSAEPKPTQPLEDRTSKEEVTKDETSAE